MERRMDDDLKNQGDTAFRVMPLEASTARVSGHGVEMTVYVPDPGTPLGASRIQVLMSPADARQLIGYLRRSVKEAEERQKGS
jgi:hypothetical protein